MAICLSERDLRRIEQDLMKKLGEGERKTGHGIPKGVRIDVWEKYVGKNEYEGKCYVCDESINITNFEVGHNKAVAKGGSDRIENLRPICRKCNSSKGTMSIEVYKRKHYPMSKRKQTARKTRRKRRKTSLERLTEQIKKHTLGS